MSAKASYKRERFFCKNCAFEIPTTECKSLKSGLRCPRCGTPLIKR